MDGHPVEVEVSVAQGLPSFTIVGLPDPSIQEARERVRSAIAASGEKWPMQRVTVNLSPAHLRKAGSSFDLAMALAVLAARERIEEARLRDLCVLGELALDGRVKSVRGVLPATIAAAAAGARAALVPAANAREAALAGVLEVLAVDHLATAVRFLRGERALDPVTGRPPVDDDAAGDVDLSDVRGNALPKHALEVAAAGGHNMLMVGAPGGGKTMLARRLPGILPPMSDEEAFEVTRVYSVAGLLPEDRPLVRRRPFRAPHHTSSTTGLIGGGSGLPRPGEVTLATRGVLFLDEFGEFRREALQALRQPLEDGTVTIVRARWSVTYPARFQLVAASNPCPCGNRGAGHGKACICLPARLSAYDERLTGPVIDRVDIQVDVPRLTKSDLFEAEPGEASATVAERVARARAIQRERWAGRGVVCNAQLPPRDLERACRLERRALKVIENEVERRDLSARGAHRVMRVARTIADLEGSETVGEPEVRLALQYRVLDRKR